LGFPRIRRSENEFIFYRLFGSRREDEVNFPSKSDSFNVYHPLMKNSTFNKNESHPPKAQTLKKTETEPETEICRPTKNLARKEKSRPRFFFNDFAAGSIEKCLQEENSEVSSMWNFDLRKCGFWFFH
jgi:hypothetical protein